MIRDIYPVVSVVPLVMDATHIWNLKILLIVKIAYFQGKFEFFFLFAGGSTPLARYASLGSELHPLFKNPGKAPDR